MSAPPYIPWYYRDYLADTVDLTFEEHGVYMLMLQISWPTEGRMPNDLAWIRRRLEACARPVHGHTYNRVIPRILDQFWKVDGDFVVNLRLFKEAQRCSKHSTKQRQNANKRWATDRGFKGLVDAVAMPARSRDSESDNNRESVSSIVGIRGREIPDYRGKPLTPSPLLMATIRGKP